VVDDILVGAQGRGTSRGVVAVGVVAFVVDSFIDVVVIFVVGGGITAIGIVVVVVVSCVVVAVGFCMCDIAVVGVAVVISRGTWGGRRWAWEDGESIHGARHPIRIRRRE